MGLTITSAPGASEPIPVSDCMRWAFQPDDADVVSTPGANASIVVTFPASPTAPSNGTMFKMWGFTLTVDDTTDYSATTFKVVAGDAGSTINNFAAMVLSNFYFNRATSVVIDYGARTVTIAWDTCGEQENFGVSQMDFSNITGTAISGATPTNGMTPVYVDGYEIQYKLRRTDINDDGNSGYITEYEGMAPNKTCTGADEAAFDAMPTARALLKTRLPDLDNTHPTVLFDGPIQYFTLLYGWTYRDSNCQQLSGDFNFTARPFVWNGFFTPEDVYRVRKYWPGATGGLPPGQSFVKFLTTGPDSMRVFLNTKCWLWYMVNEAVQSWVELRLRIIVQKKDGSGVTSTQIVTNSGYGINAVNVSPSYIFSLGLSGVDETTLDFYQVHITTQNSGSPTDLTQITETKSFYFTEQCDELRNTDLYFLTPAGGIGTLPVEIIEQSAEQQGTEILLDVPCTATRADQGRYGGRTLVDIRSFQTFTFRAISNEPEINNFFRDLKLSPQRWVRRTAEDGSFIARKLIIENGGIKIFQDGPTVSVEITGHLGDVPIQSGTEPIL